MHKEGIVPIIGMILFTATAITGAIFTSFTFLTIFAVVSVLLTAIVISFFRDPERSIPDQVDCILSPADGKVIEIQDEFESEFLQAHTTRISIFLSVFNVHVNRIPISGKVQYFRYKKGEFLKAYKSEASNVNEQTIIGIENGQVKVLFKQIAGLIARRIVCNIREGNAVKLGERFGIIKFGSRVDVFLPKNTEIKVKLNEKVKGGESIIGVISNDSK